ncbi:DNA-directed RNA polymerase III subunit RPC3 isoform X2 [Bacillus rossius redtenbacheri]
MKTRYGNEAEILVEEILRKGQDTASAVILRASERLKNTTEAGNVELTTIRDKFATLATKQFLMRCPNPVEEKAVPTLTIKERELFLPPELNLKALTELQKGENADPGDKGIYWRVNLDRFHQDFRDDIMISSMTRRFDEDVGELMRVILQQMYLRTEPWASVSNPVPFTELRDTIKKLNSHPLLIQYLDQYLKVMEEDSSCFVSKVGDSAGGQYSVNIKYAFLELTWTTVENIVLERFGSKAARIFRLIRAKKYVEQEQIQQIAMIPAKEAKLLTYKLLEENFIQMKELRKSLTAGPNKTFFLFYIKIDQVARMVIEICYKALYNALTRREHEQKENCRLIEKHQRIESITLSMRAQGIAAEQITEIEDMITPPELTLLEKVKSMIKRLSDAEMQLDDTVFMLQLFLNYHNL